MYAHQFWAHYTTTTNSLYTIVVYQVSLIPVVDIYSEHLHVYTCRPLETRGLFVQHTCPHTHAPRRKPGVVNVQVQLW